MPSTSDAVPLLTPTQVSIEHFTSVEKNPLKNVRQIVNLLLLRGLGRQTWEYLCAGVIIYHGRVDIEIRFKTNSIEI